MRTVHEVSKLAGVSVRTLHHYDAIGLLKPTQVTQAGYRLYDDAALRRLQSILLFRELQFPLQEIRQMLDSPHYDAAQALQDQIALLEMQRRHLDALLSLAREIQQKGGNTMAFQAFDKSRMERYKAEARQKWGNTDAYRAYEQNEKAGHDMNAAGEQLMQRFAQMGEMRNADPASEEAQSAIAQLQQFICDHFYPCDQQTLAGLGQMYVQDDRFRQSIDAAGGEGTAAFVQRAIEVYTK